MIHNRMLHTPIYTGTPGEPPANRPRGLTGSDNAFRGLLERKIREESQVSFSRHAIECMVERGVDISSEKIECLSEGTHMTEEKGLKGSLTLLGFTTFVVGVKGNKVVTMVSEGSLKGTVFTSIDGTIMIQPVLLETILTPNDGWVGRLGKGNRVC